MVAGFLFTTESAEGTEGRLGKFSRLDRFGVSVRFSRKVVKGGIRVGARVDVVEAVELRG